MIPTNFTAMIHDSWFRFHPRITVPDTSGETDESTRLLFFLSTVGVDKHNSTAIVCRANQVRERIWQYANFLPTILI